MVQYHTGQFSQKTNTPNPRIPAVKTIAGFRAFAQAVRELAAPHLNYETVTPYPSTLKSSAKDDETTGDNPGNQEASIEGDRRAQRYRVEKMRYGKTKENGKSVPDRTTIVYNPRITVKDIPLAAYDYVVNGKSAIDWVMERQCVKTDKASGIENDANRYGACRT